MPVGEFDTFDQCVEAHVEKGHNEEEAAAICGKIEAESKQAAPLVDTVRWNASASEAFDVHLEHLEAATLIYDWVSRFLQCPVKRVFKNNIHVPSVHLGSFFTAIEDLTANDRLEDMRNISGGTERPPVYDVIELNAENSRDFLIEGIQFFERKSGVKYVIQREPTWSGELFTIYTTVKDREHNAKLIDDAWRQATEQSWLKGAAFSISGKFLKRGDETWDDVFLTEAQQKPIERMIQTINERGAAMDNRGIVLMGPPGTGKTLAARVVKNLASATFIWVSARDFYRMGTFGGLSMAYDLARMFAPSIICLEDVDNWLDSHSIDFLKTEMDGIDQSAGVATLLTTNFPERFPEALIDRPGRFHDVIQIGLPNEDVRARMLAKWIPAASKKTISEIAKATDGLAGAHIKELAKFAATLAKEQEDLGIDAAVQQALQRVVEQRELISKRHEMNHRATRPERLSAPRCAVFSPAITYADAVSRVEIEDNEIPSIAAVAFTSNGSYTEAEASDMVNGTVAGNEIIQRIMSSDHPHDPVTGRPFVQDVDTVAQDGSWRGSDMSIEFINVTRRGNERNRNGSLVQIAEANGFKGLKTEMWEAHRGTWLFGHGLMPGFQLPIGNSFNKKTNRVEFSKSKHRMTSRLFLSQTLPEAEVIAKLLEEGILNCCSVQFLPIVGRELGEEEREVPEGQDATGLVAFGRALPFEFMESDLFENSVVPIPADAHAIRKGIETGKIGHVRVPQSVMPSLKLMAGQDTPAQSGWTASASPKRAEYRYYESIGERSREFVAPTEGGLIAIMQAAGVSQPAAIEMPASNSRQNAENSESAIDYGGLAEMLKQNSKQAAPPPATVDASLMQQALRDAFRPVHERLSRTEEAMKRLTGAVN